MWRPASVPGRSGSPGAAIDPVRLLLTCLITLDVLVMAGNVVHLKVNEPQERHDPIFSAPAWNGDLDGSYPEFLGYLQLIAAIVVLVTLCRHRRTLLYAAWALVLTAVVADDLLRLHERIGATLARGLDLPAVGGLRAQDLGELGVWAAGAALLAPLLLVAHLRAPAADRRNSLLLLVLFVLLFGFAAGLDLVHVAVLPYVSTGTMRVLTLTETAGELAVMSLMLVAVARMAMRPPGPAEDPVADAVSPPAAAVPQNQP